MISIIRDNHELNIQAIIELVREEHPERQDVISGLQNCIGGHWISRGYYQFVNPTNANQVGVEWQHDDCIVITKVDIVIDLLKDGRIGGIEFVSLISDMK